MTMTPKQALTKDNLTRPEAERIPVKEGRGRLSRDAVERCKYLASNGWDIAGYVVAAAKPATPTTAALPAGVTKIVVNNVKEIADFTILHPENMFKAVGPGKRVYGMREACNNCRVSLVQCNCGSPTILGDIRVSIVAK